MKIFIGFVIGYICGILAIAFAQSGYDEKRKKIADVGFWDKEGIYKEDIQEVDKQELKFT